MGVLYVVDSVTRQWVEAARKAGQQLGSSAPDGTFAAGVNRVTELLPVLMTDIINNAPEDQKVRSSRKCRIIIQTITETICGQKRPMSHGWLWQESRWSLIRSDLRISRYIPPYPPLRRCVLMLRSSHSTVCVRIVELTYCVSSRYRKKSRSWLISGSVDTLSLLRCLPLSRKN